MYQPSGEFGGGPLPPAYDTAVAIVGMAGRFAGARTIDDYWANLRGGVESIAPYADDDLIAAGVEPKLLKADRYVKSGAPLPDMECFDAALFGLSPREAAIMDPQHRHFLQCTWAALENAGHTPERFAGAIGVFAGSGHNAYLPYNLLTNPKLVRDTGLFLLRHTGNDKDFLTTRVSYLLNLKGPSVNVQTACSTSLVAIHMGVQSLLNGECDMALAGAASIELPHRQGYLYEEGEILSPDGHCRPFDAASQGTVFGSGAGVVVLRRLKDAIEDGDHVYAVIRGSAINNDGSGKVGYLAPSVDGQAQVITEALGVAGVDPGAISYIEAHGTGTPVGDPIEVTALTQAFRQHTDETGFCGIGSVKANIGHTDTAAGVAGVIKVALALHHGEVPPSLNYDQANPACDFAQSPFFVTSQLQPWRRHGGHPLRAGISSLGVGGTNAHVVLEEAPKRPAAGPSRAHQVLTLSARSASALDANTRALATHLSGHRELDLADAAYTLDIGRQALNHRRIVIAASADDAASALVDPARVFTAQAIADRPVAFLFGGAGCHYVDMARGLYEAETVFREAVDECIAHLDRIASIDLRRWLFPLPEDRDEAAREIDRPSISLPALFTIQVALARLWMSWGVRPSAMIGHSAGEYAAAHLAGVFKLEDALRLVLTRAQLFETLPEGAMLSVPLPEDALRSRLTADLTIALINGPHLCVASGPAEAIAGLRAALEADEIECQPVRISVAAHSAMLDRILPDFRRAIADITLDPPTLPFVSNLTGAWITPAQATDRDYWARHLRETVRFADGLERLLEDKDQVLLEVGPGRMMSSLARQHPARSKDQPVLGSLRHPDERADDHAFLLETLGRLWALGVPLNWGRFWIGERRRRVPLPSYCFDRTRHWIEPGKLTAGAAAPDDDEPLEKHADIADWFYEPVWRRTALPRSRPVSAPTLVFADDQGLGTALAATLRAQGRTVVTVRPGRRFARSSNEFTIDPRNPADYERLVSRLASDGNLPGQIYHCWLVTGPASYHDRPRDAAVLQDRGLYSMLFLAQALAAEDVADRADRADRIDIAIVSDGMQRVCAEQDLMPAKATVLGPARVIAREHPNLHVRAIDIAASAARTGHGGIVDMLIDEFGVHDEAETIAYRARERWVQSFEPARRDAPALAAPGTCRFRSGGVYFITGGLGGLGFTVARHLADSCAARLALVTRRALPPRDRWSAVIADSPVGDPTSHRIRQVLSLEALGSEVLVIAADVCDGRAMRHAVRRAHARFGRIDGVFHAAGVLDDGLVQLKSRDAAEAVIAPKLYGTLALHDALAREHPDFVMLFSSISAFAGIAGQIDYAAANAFLDAYAQARHGDARTCVMSIGWSQWQEVGMAAALAGNAGQGPIANLSAPGQPLDHPFLDTVHVISSDEVVAIGALSAGTHWLIDEHRLADGTALIPGTGFIEIARAAFTTIAKGPVTLSEIAFLVPFTVPAGTTRDLRIELRRRDGDSWRFEVFGRGAAVPGTEWVEHMHGLIEPATIVDDRSIALADILGRCAEQPAARADASPHLRFGPRWSTIREQRIGTHEALLHLELPDDFHADLESIALHPALLDFATAGAQTLIPGYDAACDFFAPMSYGKITMLAPLPAAIVSHIRYRTDAIDSGALATFDVTLTDEAGAVLAEIHDFTMIRMRDPALLASPVAPAMLARPATSVRGELAGGLLPEEGLRVIERILHGAPASHIVVSPQDLQPAVARLRAPKRAAPPRARADDDDADAPVTAAEHIIARLWSEMLGIERIGRTDDFFDLGGHSLLAVQFTNRLRKQTGKMLPLSALLETPTLDRLAALLDPESATLTPAAAAVADTVPIARSGDLIAIRAGGGTKPPLFLVHDGLGETLLYRGLALRLDPGHAVYGIEPGRRCDGSFRHTRIDEMAADYIERIRHMQPHGPYLIAGLCAGGVIAFEMARQLQEAGETVALVGIIDGADVEASRQRLYIARSRLQRIRALLGGGQGSLVGAVPTLLRKAANAATWEVTSRIEQARRSQAVERMRQRAAPGDAAVPKPPDLSFLQLYGVAHRLHRPRGLFAGGDVVLFRATHGNGADDDVPFSELYSDCILGWGKRVANDVRVIALPGGHTSVLREPHVDTLAAELQQAINDALGRGQPKPTIGARPAESTHIPPASSTELVSL